MFSFRRACWLIFAACAALLGFGLYLQHVEGLEPCPLCIAQRIFFILTGAMALLAALHGPKGWGRPVYGSLMAVSALLGAAVAGRHAWLQRQPPNPFAECGPGLNYLLENFPLKESLPMLFKGSGDCGKIAWRFLALSIPDWALLWFLLLGATALWAGWGRR